MTEWQYRQHMIFRRQSMISIPHKSSLPPARRTSGRFTPAVGSVLENAAFAKAVVESGFAFVGPTPESIQMMRDKIRARNFVQQNGFPVVTSAIEEDDPASFILSAQSIGSPLRPALAKAKAQTTSSKMRMIPFRVQTSRTCSIWPGEARPGPKWKTTGSIIIAARTAQCSAIRRSNP